MKESTKARAMMAFSMTVFGTIGLFVKNIPLSSAGLALCRAVMAAVLILLYLLVSGQKLKLRGLGRDLPLLLLSGVAMGVNWILLFEAYRYTSVSLATLSYYFAPVIVMVACPILFRERLTPRQILCFVLSTAGLVLIVGVTGLNGGGDHLTGILFGLGAAVFYACVILLNKGIRGVTGLHRTLLQFAAAIVVLIPYVLCTEGTELTALRVMDGKGLLCLLAVGVLHTGVAYCTYFSALRVLPGQETAILSYIDPLVAVILSVAVLGEPMTVPQLVGGVLLLGFTLLNELGGKKTPAR